MTGQSSDGDLIVPTPHPLAGKPVPVSRLVNVAALVAAYADERPDPSEPAQRVAFGTSGHRGSSLERSFNEAHVIAITQAICDYRRAHAIDGPVFLGWDTHALSEPARVNVLEVLAANSVDAMVDTRDDVVPTPGISHAILAHNDGRTAGLADGIVITPSHNPPEQGGIKYDPPTGGPADTFVTRWIEERANALLEAGLRDVRRLPWDRARAAATMHRFDYRAAYVDALRDVIDIDVLQHARLDVGIDPLGGASLRYWEAIGERYGLPLRIINAAVDPTFRFMTVDADGAVRMDPSSPYAMAGVIDQRDQFDLIVASDPDADRYGIVSRGRGLLDPNQFLAMSAAYLFRHRPHWNKALAVGKSVVTSDLVSRVAARLGRRLFEVPVGFKHFVAGLHDGSLGIAGEESAGASFLRKDGLVWTTDKDGLIMGLLAMESMARTGRDLDEQYTALVTDVGESFTARIDRPATAAQKAALARLTPDDIRVTSLAGDPIRAVHTTASGNGQPIGGLKLVTDRGWFAARPSGTEARYKLYAESARDRAHLQRIQDEAGSIITAAIGSATTNDHLLGARATDRT